VILGKFKSAIVDKIRGAFEKTRKAISSQIAEIISSPSLDEDTLLRLEEVLLQADVGIESTSYIIERIKREKGKGLRDALIDAIVECFPPHDYPRGFQVPVKPWVIMIVGVNGSGKTTTCAKLAYQYKNAGYSVILGAADTFRAAAVEQLQKWGERVGVPVHGDKSIKDPGAVAYTTLEKAKKENIDVVIIDTAGRLHNKENLMRELARIRRIQAKVISDAPHEVLLVVDASTGSNALVQAREFLTMTNVTGVVITKVDGTAKGGCIIPVARELKLPVRYLGTGEKKDDIVEFDPYQFALSLIETETSELKLN